MGEGPPLFITSFIIQMGAFFFAGNFVGVVVKGKPKGHPFFLGGGGGWGGGRVALF